MNVISQIAKIRKKIEKTPGCSYLYGHFDKLVKLLKARTLTSEENQSLKDLIRDYAVDSRFNNFASANWMRYSARCFYCADYLLAFLTDEQEVMQKYLNGYFMELLEHYVAPIISQEVLDKYIRINITTLNITEFYSILIRKACEGCGKCRYWRANETTLALVYTKSASRLIMEYVNKYSDVSTLKDWLPLFETGRWANIWYEYPDSANFHYAKVHERNAVIDALDEILDIHLELMSFWYWHNSQEFVDTLSLHDLIEILEVCDDNEFERALRYAVTLPYHEKVAGVLRHFEHDDERWVVELSQQLLAGYH